MSNNPVYNPALNHPARRHPALSYILSDTTYLMSTEKSPSPRPTESEEHSAPSPGAPHQSPAPETANTPVQDEQARARNAAAQARHRQKRKAYVSQLEKSVVTLREALKQTNTTAKLRELEDENRRLTAELMYLQSQAEGGDDAPGGWAGPGGASSTQGAGYAPRYAIPQGYPGPGAPYDDAEVDDSVDSREFGLQGWTPGSK